MGANVISLNNIQIAKEIQSNLIGLRSRKFMREDGEIQIALYHGSYYLEFTIETNGFITYRMEIDEQEKEYKDRLSLNEAIEVIKDFRQSISITTNTQK